MGLVDAVNEDGESAIHLAAAKGNITALSVLLDYSSADVEVKNSLLRTPLSYAAEQGHQQCSELLIKHQATIDSADKV